VSDGATDRDGDGERDDSGERNPGDGRSVDARDGADGDVPLSDLAERVAERRERRTERADIKAGSRQGGGETGETDDADPFEEMAVGEIDEETLWSSLEDPDDPAATVGGAEAAEPVDDAEPDAREYVVDKGEYCQRCPHLSDPPELSCTHEGTRIVEVEDVDHFRVRNCPIVEQ
jgi:hypothetical protein